MRVLGRYMKMPVKPRKKPMSLSAFKKKVGCMLETISRLESTERTEAYGYLQNCVNVLGVHKLGLSQADIASLLHKPDMTSSSKVNTTQESTNQVKSQDIKPAPSTSSSIQVSVISRNDRANVINFRRADSVDSPTTDIILNSDASPKSSYVEKIQDPTTENSSVPFAEENVGESVVSSSALPNDIIDQEPIGHAIPSAVLSPLSEIPAEDSSDALSLLACHECGMKLKSRRAMLAHLDRHASISMSCRACRKTFNSLAALKYHYEDFCTSKNLVCPQCEEVFSCRTHFNNHVEGHNRNNCQMCPALFTNRKNLVVHMADAHEVHILADAAFVCSVAECGRRFVKRSTLHRHMQLRHAAEGQLVCITCGAYCEGEEEFRSHTESHKLWTCDVCSESFTRRQQYLVHMTSHETSKYKCVTCDQVLPTKVRVLEHRKDGHQVEGLSVDFACDKCDQRFHTAAELRDHSHIHKPPGAISCKFCHKTFSTKKICNSHMRTQHGVTIENGSEASLICEQCGKQFRSPSLLAKHLKGVHNEQVFTCCFCDHKTNNEVNMRRHRALHTSQEQQYVCDQCGASFQALSTLKDHNLFVHSEERNFNCDVCKKSFKRRNDLRRHHRSHSNDRMYVCHCKQSYKFMAHLRRHQEAAHKTVSNGRKVQRLVEDSSGNLVLRPKPAKEKKNAKEKKVLSSKASSSKSTKDLSSPASTVQQEETTVPLIAVSESEHVVAMSVSDLQISNQHIDPYNLQVTYDGLSYADAKTQLVYTTTQPSSHVMSLQLPQFELVPTAYDVDTVMDMSTTSHADMTNSHSSMLMSIATSEPSPQPVMTLITGLEHSTLFTAQAEIGSLTEHSSAYSENLMHHTQSSVTPVKSVDNYTETHVLETKTSQADINTVSDMYSVYESQCVTSHQHHQHHELTSLNYSNLDPCNSILIPPEQAWHLHSEATNLPQYSTC